MSEYGAHWERKLRTAFKRLDSDGNGFLTKKDVDQIAENVIRTGNFTGSEAEEIRNSYLEIWEKYVKPIGGGEAATCETYLEKLKSHGKSALVLAMTQQLGVFFDAVDTNKDDLIQLQEFIIYFDAFGIKEEIAKEAFKGLDTNHDGVLSREEFITAGKDWITLEEPSLPSDLFFGSLI